MEIVEVTVGAMLTVHAGGVRMSETASTTDGNALVELVVVTTATYRLVA